MRDPKKIPKIPDVPMEILSPIERKIYHILKAREKK